MSKELRNPLLLPLIRQARIHLWADCIQISHCPRYIVESARLWCGIFRVHELHRKLQLDKSWHFSSVEKILVHFLQIQNSRPRLYVRWAPSSDGTGKTLR